jgi:hypothetical protein
LVGARSRKVHETCSNFGLDREIPIMYLINKGKILTPRISRLAVAVMLLLAPTLAGCISSSAPVLSDAGAILGESGEIHLFGAGKGGLRDHQVVTFRWTGSRYLLGGSSIGVSEFTAYAFEGRDLIVQSTASQAPHPVEYAIARKLASGVYLLIPISEEDADDATRERFCTKALDASCHVETPEQLFVFAHATAAKEQEGGGIAVVIAGAPDEHRAQ